MTIHKHGVSAASIGALMAENLQIPHYQRPYVWTPPLALRLVLDIRDAQQAASTIPDPRTAPYVLGAVILHENGEHFDVVDGQQRLLTLRMLLRILEGEKSLSPRSTNRATPVTEVWRQLKDTVRALEPDERQDLAQFIRNNCQVIRVVTDDVDEAFRVFDSQNYRGKPLAPHDLLKAHHLREMRGESDALKSATVEEWESAGDKALDEIFSLYLYRIAKWSRGESAPGFTTGDINVFKGIAATGPLSPNARYHLTAQSTIPLMNIWRHASTAKDKLDSQRSRFQLDAPQLAGRPFFEMVAFMIQELDSLKNRNFPAVDGPETNITPSTFGDKLTQSRYRKVTELYLAAMLYFVNKFSDEDIELASTHLFAWSFDLRVRYLRVVQTSINNSGYGKDGIDSPFSLLRNSSDGRVVQTLTSTGSRYNDTHEPELYALLNGTMP
ncbi:DUF262 domain-containing protein [Paenarthrobacter sp. TYUT067]|uniref:DUF262 domain-containing protein n=1 Tax=Paenarthrobacter sp. TYUT067 TaxID=2926245 RepID=UPI00202F4D8F|nr:DUF262 domain-containing protein [Paenarthrobacter sp. TYUT067]MCM0618060.1 DUF262 domain-containing protein [Paenarthrobacter sp. TYUT067]